MGEIVRFVIEKLRHVGILFGGKSFKELSERGWIYAKYVSEIERYINNRLNFLRGTPEKKISCCTFYTTI